MPTLANLSNENEELRQTKTDTVPKTQFVQYIKLNVFPNFEWFCFVNKLFKLID